jgi:aminopeptidase N
VTAPAAALTGTAAVLTAGTSAASAQTPALRGGGTPGAETLPEPDPVFPALGNDGYSVTAYHLDFSYDAMNRLVDAIATLTLRATQDLSRFSLDALGLDIRSVRVGGRTAAFEQIDEKLRVTPACPLPERARVTVRIEYSADPSRTLAHTGWVVTPDGFAVCAQPNSAHTVFPCNDHPTDKAAFSFRVTVPRGLRGVANGTLVRAENLDGDRTAYTYRSRHPMATELVQITVGDYTVKDRRGPHGLPLRDVVPTARAAALEPALSLTHQGS